MRKLDLGKDGRAFALVVAALTERGQKPDPTKWELYEPIAGEPFYVGDAQDDKGEWDWVACPLNDSFICFFLDKMTDEQFQTVRKKTNLKCRKCGKCCIQLAIKGRLTKDGFYKEREEPCRYLGKDNLCSIYKDRPDVCKGWPGDLITRPREGGRILAGSYMFAEICPILKELWTNVYKFSLRRVKRKSKKE